MIEKFKEIKEECQKAKTNENIETMYVVADFEKMRSIVDYE